MKLSHDPNETPTRKTNRDTKHVFGVQENRNTQIWNIRLAPSPNLTRTSHVPRNALEKNRNAPNTRNAFWHSINSRLSLGDSQNKHSNTTVSHTSHVAKETSESKRRCDSSETSASDLYIDWHPWLRAPHKNTCDTNVKQLETNARNDMRRLAMHRQIRPRKTAVGQLRFGNKLENPILRATRAKIMIILGALWNTALICLAKHGTRIDVWILIADANVTNARKSNLQREIHLGQNTDALHEPRHRTMIISFKNSSETHCWQFSICVKWDRKKRFSLNSQQRIRSHNLPLQTRAGTDSTTLKRNKTNMKRRHNETSLFHFYARTWIQLPDFRSKQRR